MNSTYSAIAHNTLQTSLSDTSTNNLTAKRIDANTIYLPILKCASSWMAKVTESYECTHDRQAERVLIVVRDPLERWITGMCTYARLMHTLNWSNNTTEPGALLKELIMKTEVTPWFDSHCLPMHYYVQHLPVESLTAFRINSLKTDWAKFTQTQLPNNLYKNRNQDNSNTAWVKPVIEKLYQTIKPTVDHHLAADYELLRTVRYYN